jgi:hypothetical protein
MAGGTVRCERWGGITFPIDLRVGCKHCSDGLDEFKKRSLHLARNACAARSWARSLEVYKEAIAARSSQPTPGQRSFGDSHC